MQTVLLATRNAHKIAEIQAILGKAIKCFSLDNFPGAPQVAEDAPDFAGNAMKKALGLAHWLRREYEFGDEARSHPPSDSPDVSTRRSFPGFVLADDSGLEVDVLNGAPGVYSARFAALVGQSGNSSDTANNQKLLRLMHDVPLHRRTARFRCVLALTQIMPPQKGNASPVCYADELELATELFEGCCEGRIEFTPKGQGGFGYDPLFSPAGFNQTFSELGEDVKNQLSHRAKALAKLKQWFENQFQPSKHFRQK
jgi:XTP/dITP diphosphohydrolase